MKPPTIVALSTPAGMGALGVIRLSGSEARTIAQKHLAKDIMTLQGYDMVLSNFVDAEEVIIDEVIVSIFLAPRTYTGEDVVELSCHGSAYILRRVLSILLDAGATLAKPGEFTQRAFANGKMDLTQAEAVADLIASESKAAHQVALRQMKGGITNDIATLRQQLIDFASLIELELDFGEEDVAFADRTQLQSLIKTIREHIATLINSFTLGNALKNGVNTVIAGRPNAGKSTLLNTLLDESRAIVSDIPGTTRDSIEEVLNINGIAFRLIDTAGLRSSTDEIEQIGIQRTLAKIQTADILLYIYDITEQSATDVINAVESLMNTYDVSAHQVVLVPNKIDQIKALDLQPFTAAGLTNIQIVPISALNKSGIDTLQQQLYDLATDGQSLTESTIITSTRHLEALRRTDTALQDVLEGMATDRSSDLIATDIRQALHYLGEISGDITTDDLLGNIFGKFCIGK